jgi:predicted CopG family antitoxin
MQTELLPMARTIKISDETHKSLMSIGGKGETFDDVIKRLIDSYKKSAKK